MGYRYSDREIEVLKRNEVLIEARRTARLGDAPIEPDRDDYEAIEFLMIIKMDFDDRVGERDLSEDPFDSDVAYEIADNSVPYNDYKAAMAYAQLGLYNYEDFAGRTYGDRIENIRQTLFSFGYNAVEAMLNDF